jgi:signal transduction histidine kinase
VRTRRPLLIAIPVALIAVIEILSDTMLDERLPFPGDTILVVAIVAVFTTIGSWLAWRAIDRLTSALERRNRELESRAATTRTLHQVGMAIAGLADLDAILKVGVDSARTLLRADVAVLVRAAPDGTFYLAGASGPADLVVRAGPVTSDDARAFIAPAATVSKLAVPLRRGDATVGTLAVGSTTERSYGIDEIEALSTLASQASIAIENARLQDQLQEVAVRGERERIARELHDGLAQVLGYVNTKSQAVEELLGAGRIDEARSHLSELSAAARSVYVDVREAILGLSSPLLEGSGLAGTVEQYGRRFAEASKLAVHVQATPAARAAVLPPTVEAQVFRIVQEALTNVRKHAAANRVDVALDFNDAAMRIEIRDDGRGLASATDAGEAWPRYGLTSMRERAEAIGGSIDWASTDGGGTTVHLTVPLEAAAPPMGAA